MADPLSIGSGIVGILGLTISITQIVVQFGLDWKDAPKEAKSIVSELQSLKVVMLEIEKAETNLLLNTDFIDAFQDQPSILLSELGPTAPTTTETKLSINVCKQELESLLDKLKKIGKGHRVGWERLKAPFLTKDLQKSIDKVHRQCRILNDMISYDAINLGVNTFGQVKRARKEQKEWHDALENREILNWLSDLNFEQKQTDILSRRHPGTGEWFLNLDIFKAWRNGHQDSSTLWCPAGAGKSVMTSIVIENLLKIYDKDTVSISYIYCDYKDRAKQTTTNLLANLVKQLVLQHGDMPREVTKMYVKHTKRKSSPSLGELSQLVPSLLRGFRRSFILFDALDEHFTSENEESILEVTLLEELLKLQQKGPGYTLFITSRENPVIQERLSGTVQIEISAANADIELYLRSRIYDRSKFRFAEKIRDDKDLADLVIGSLLKKAQGMFLLPCLHLDRLSCQTNIRDLRKALDALPTRLGETYSEAMTRIHGQVPEHSELALSALRWISHALRPLRVEELQCALAVQPGDRSLDTEALPDIALIVSVSAGLITIDLESQTIRLAHFTVEEYFKQAKHKYFPDANTLIAETCITYLSFDVFRFDPLPIQTSENLPVSMKSQHVLLNYAAYNWGHHLCADAEHALQDLAFDFLTKDENLVYPGQAFLDAKVSKVSIYATRRLSPQDRITGFYLMVYFNLTHILSIFLEKNRSFQIKRSQLLTPLSLAVRMGHTEMVRLLIDRKDAMMDCHYDETITPVHHAAKSGHETILSILLQREDGKADSSDSEGRTPLHCSIEHGHEGIARLLLKRDDVRLYSQDSDGRTPLDYAVIFERNTITKMLLLARDDVAINHQNSCGETPLWAAAYRGHTTIVQLLLERKNIKPDLEDNYGRTPLLIAARQGCIEIVPLLIKRDDVAINHETLIGHTPLFWAAQRGHTSIVKLLLKCMDVKPDLENTFGWTPLSLAARWGYLVIVGLLIERDDVAVDRVDQLGHTPLFEACSEGNTTIVKLLLERKDVKPDLKSKNGSTPFSVAARRGNINIVRHLMERGDVAVNHRTRSGQTPLFLAILHERTAIVKLLIKCEDVRVDL